MGMDTGTPGWARRLPITSAALSYARDAHLGQFRKADGAPFVSHPCEVASLLHEAQRPDYLIAAGALHDVVEKTPITSSELHGQFGSKIASLVLALTEDERVHGYARRKAALRSQVETAGEDALTLFAADKISKAREIRLNQPTLGLRAIRDHPRRLAHYRDSLALLRERLPDSPLVEQLAVELAHLPNWPSAHARAAMPAFLASQLQG